MNEEKRRALTIILVLLIFLTLTFIWGNSLLNGKNSAEISNGFLEAVTPLLRVFGLNCYDDHWLRKLAHFGEFGALGAELCALFALYRPMRIRLIGCCALVSLAVASIDETIQLFSDRFASAADVFLDLAGALTGVLLTYLIICLIVRKKSME